MIKQIPLTENNKLKVLLNNVLLHEFMTLEGPPGSGKTVLLAQLAMNLVREGKSILLLCATKNSILEFCDKTFTKPLREKGEIGLVKATKEEQIHYKGLHSIETTQLTSVDYKIVAATIDDIDLSFVEEKQSIWDLIIVDEAGLMSRDSLDRTKQFGRSIIWTGDKYQIRSSQEQDVFTQFCLSPEYKHFVLSITYRLNKRSAQFTSIFYGTNIVSKREDDIINLGVLGFHSEGGPCLIEFDSRGYHFFEDCFNYVYHKLIPLVDGKELCWIVDDNDIMPIYQLYCTKQGINNPIPMCLSSDSQGLSIDIALVIIQNHSILDTSKFNVATSRAKHYTLLFADNNLYHYLRKANNEKIDFYIHQLKKDNYEKK